MSPQAVIDAVIAALISLHADDISPPPFYSEAIPQGFVRPCYFLSAKQSEKPLMDERALRQIDVSILRYPHPDEDPRAVGLASAEMLSLALEWINIDQRPRRAVSIEHSIRDQDHVLSLELRYDFHVLKHRDPVKMISLDHDELVR